MSRLKTRKIGRSREVRGERQRDEDAKVREGGSGRALEDAGTPLDFLEELLQDVEDERVGVEAAVTGPDELLEVLPVQTLLDEFLHGRLYLRFPRG